MNEGSSRQIDKALFTAAAAINDAEARREFLARACADNAARLTRVTGWLETQASAEKFFINATIARTEIGSEVAHTLDGSPSGRKQAAKDDEPGALIGRYRLLERIGEGGCGVVYLAEQLEPVRRRVALKVIRSGLDSASVMARFESERQTLALMDHPGIARVFDAGATDGGRPYFVMELVSGEKITTHCDARQLGISERLELFIQVCQAIQHAHQKGIIHRDIKPSNVLVIQQDGVAVPKVIDFGIARAVERTNRDQTYATAFGQLLGTPAYMSPEQAEGGQAPDTRGDVYSLGVLLYELLTGGTPFDGKRLTQAGLFEMLRVLREEEPPSPSEVLAHLDSENLAQVAAARDATPAALGNTVRGDLDWIVSKAMSKDRRGRYDTVNGLAMDVRRFLNHQPVAARPQGRFYLFRKLLRRHRLAFSAAAVVTVALIAGLGVSSWFYVRERKARELQANMREAAESARAIEARLLLQSKARESVSRAAMLLADGKIEEADSMLLETPLNSIEPSMEAANVFRILGDWNAMRQRWQQAGDCYALFLQANQLGHLSQPDPGLLLLNSIAPTLVEAGNLTEYERLRDIALLRHGNATDPQERYNLLKACLLLPADEVLLSRLQPHADALRELLAGGKIDEGKTFYRSFTELSLAMMSWRSGDFSGTLKWSRDCLACPEPNESRSAIAHSLAAMAQQRLGQKQQARIDLENARAILAGPCEPDVPFPRGEANGRWFSWVLARQFEREATGLIDGADGAAR